MKKNELKAVELVRKIRDQHYAVLKGKSHEERREFYKKEAEAFHRRLAVKQPSRKS